jgi:hypothetical protein
MAGSDSAAAARRGLFPEGERPVLVTRRHPGKIGRRYGNLGFRSETECCFLSRIKNEQLPFAEARFNPRRKNCSRWGKAAPGNIVEVGIET